MLPMYVVIVYNGYIFSQVLFIPRVHSLQIFMLASSIKYVYQKPILLLQSTSASAIEG
jgi:hypothetical protein